MPPTRPRSTHKGQPTLILAKTVKGYGMGEAGEGQNITHQQKKMGEEALREFRDRFQIPITDEQLDEMPFIRFAEDSAGDGVSARAPAGARRLPAVAPAQVGDAAGAAARGIRGAAQGHRRTARSRPRWPSCGSSTRCCATRRIGKRIVPIVPDESRTFGMEGMFRQFGIFSQVGQLYRPEDANQLMFYKEDKNGQMLQEGINEPGAMCLLDRGGDVLLRRRTCR